MMFGGLITKKYNPTFSTICLHPCQSLNFVPFNYQRFQSGEFIVCTGMMGPKISFSTPYLDLFFTGCPDKGMELSDFSSDGCSLFVDGTFENP